MFAPTKTTPKKLRALTEARKMLELEEEVFILRQALDEVKTELDKTKKEHQKTIDELRILNEDFHAVTKDYTTLEKRFVAVSSLINIPDNLREMVFELIKARLMVWDRLLLSGEKSAEEVTDENQKFLWFQNIIRYPATPAKTKKRGKKS